MSSADWQIMLTGSFVAVSCGLLGCYLILRRMAMVGDAISHAVLPGIVLAFLVSGSRDTLVMLIGAGLIGLLTTFLIEFFHKKARLQTDASIGVTFTWFFALGVILISVYAGQVDLDQECVLYGEIAYVPIDLWILDDGTIIGPRALFITGGLLLVVVAGILLFYKELYLTTFDPAFATALGISAALWHYILMGAVSLTTIASFESVGAILVVAFLIAPAATAYLLTDNFRTMLWIAAGVGVAISVSGYYLAVWLNGSIAGAMASAAGLLFMLAFLFSPSHGVVFRQRRMRKGAEKVRKEKLTSGR
ncbi:metal ABC transporter permease [Roseivirga sp. BDSF3-8]|uniref:metal ABC transporter permease n=1 Tax=Roseivirga sp. BDSF3-8 TaxID=3241598 RepID=UPI00353213E7